MGLVRILSSQSDRGGALSVAAADSLGFGQRVACPQANGQIDGTNLNQQLVANGYAFYYPYFPFSKSTEFNTDEQAAKAANKGLWGACTPTPSDNGGYKMDETQAQANGA